MNDFLDDKEDLGNYPVQFQYLKFFLDASSQTAGQKYKIQHQKFRLVYRQSHFEQSQTLHWHPRYEFFLIQVKAGETDVYLQIEEPAANIGTSVRLERKLLVSKNYGKCESGIIAIPISSLQPGNYLLNINKDGKSDVAKLIIK